MHYSRLCAVLIDCQTSDLEGAARFWGEALGRPERHCGDGQPVGELHPEHRLDARGAHVRPPPKPRRRCATAAAAVASDTSNTIPRTRRVRLSATILNLHPSCKGSVSYHFNST